MGAKTIVSSSFARFGGRMGSAWRIFAFVCVAFSAPPVLAEWDDIRFRLGADLTYDDNVSRAREDDKFDDSFGTLNLGVTSPWQWSKTTRVVLNGNVGAEQFEVFSGLDRSYANIQAEVQYRSSGQFGTPIWSVFGRHGQDWYKSGLRDGFRDSIGIAVRKPVTDKIFFFGALAYNQRDGRSRVFDTKEVAVRANLDYSLSRRQTLYFGLEVRDGDIVSTARPDLAFFDIAEALITDDVFVDTTRFAYRFKAYTSIATLGYNLGLGEKFALDLSYRLAYSLPHEQPPGVVTADTIDYFDNQVTLSLLYRF